MGILNGRIWTEQSFPEEFTAPYKNIKEIRCSKDVVVNLKGLKVLKLFNESGLLH